MYKRQGLYRAEGYISANLARKVTGFSEDDLELLWEAIINMFENDHSAARGKMAVRELIVFKHSKELGDCPAYKPVSYTHLNDLFLPSRCRSFRYRIFYEKWAGGTTIRSKYEHSIEKVRKSHFRLVEK